MEGEGRTEIIAESEVREGDQVTTPNPYQDGQIQRGGSKNCRDGGRLAKIAIDRGNGESSSCRIT